MTKDLTLPTVSIVVLNWNGKRFIDAFMKTFSSQTYDQALLELLFVDNDSADDSIDYLRQNYSNVKNLRIIQNGGNYGYAGGNNRGIHQANGDYILVCNNDLELDKALVQEMVSLALDKEAALVVPKLMYLNKPGIINNAGSQLNTNSDWPIVEIGKDEKDTGQYDEVRQISAFCGACVLFSRQFLETVGLFDARFFMYFEDGDLSWRGQKAGSKFYYAPRAVANHVHTGSSTEGSPLFNHYVGRNRMLILAKNASFKVFAKGSAKTVRDHLLFRLKNIWASLSGRYSKKLALREFYLSQKILCSSLILLPYAFLKRIGVIKEDKL